MISSLRYASLFSGAGSTTAALYEADQRQEVEGMEFGVAIATNKHSIELAVARGIRKQAIVLLEPERYGYSHESTNESFGDNLLGILDKRGIDVVLQNGWMYKTPVNVIERFEGNIFNQHPGPPEDFGNLKGLQVHGAILLYRRNIQKLRLGNDMWTEVVAQRVAPQWDEGSVVGSNRIDIFPDDSPMDLQERCLPLEHALQIQLLRDITSNKVSEQRRHPIVRTSEEKSVLKQSRAEARLMFPKG